MNTFLTLNSQNPEDNIQIRKIYNLMYQGFSYQLVIGVDSITNQVGLLELRNSFFDLAENVDNYNFYEIIQHFNVKETAFNMNDEIEVDVAHQTERILYSTLYKDRQMKQSTIYFYLPEIDFYAVCQYHKGVTSFLDGDEPYQEERFDEFETFNLLSLVENIN